ncbi:hypothetical protein Poly30_46060 [Planctomycetes bacterium Poly30]|uniref:Uncharacterized protein n=1 Tax=Saltatorellus ferox TaxID=2528018 RepID=A0A518EY85_9BACT|nr:hypothetical protein Poly30_46060 [Planctomycetes bacterium Poly30]
MGETNDQGPGDDPSGSEGTARRRGLLGGIIKTSKATTARPTPETASLAARKCRSCGAGRPEGTDLRVCAYCGDRFMTDDAGPGVDAGGASADS